MGHMIRECHSTEGSCYNCGKNGHMARECHAPKQNNQRANHLTWEEEEGEETEIYNLYESEEEEVSKVNRAYLSRHSIRNYDPVKDFMATPSSIMFGDVIKVPEFRKPLMRALQDID